MSAIFKFGRKKLFEEFIHYSGGSRISRRGGACTRKGRGLGPPTQVLFGENVCENERIGSHKGWRAPGTPPPRSANALPKHQNGVLLLKYS